MEATSPSAMSKSRVVMAGLVLLVLSTAFALAATAALGAIADANNWCCVHSWALAHGSGLVVLLLFGLVGYHLFRALGMRVGLLPRTKGFDGLAHAAYLGGAFGTLFFTTHVMWVGLVAGVVALVLRLRGGRPTESFGLAMIGLVVSVLAIAYWGYFAWIFWSIRSGG